MNYLISHTHWLYILLEGAVSLSPMFTQLQDFLWTQVNSSVLGREEPGSVECGNGCLGGGYISGSRSGAEATGNKNLKMVFKMWKMSSME